MNVDRYEHVAAMLTKHGWLLDLILRNTRKCMVEVLKKRNVKHVLDACCGSGTLSRYLKDSGIQVTGVDASPSMLALARQKAPGVRFIEADMTVFAMEESGKSVDAAVIALALHEMNEELRVKVWRDVKRATNEGGVIVVADFAIPAKKGLFARISGKSIWNKEKSIGEHDPGHFESFQEFIKNGGIKNWLISHDEAIVGEQYFLWGNIGVLTVQA